MKNKLLLIVAHPHLKDAKLNHALVKGAENVPGVTVHDLYAKYPDFKINIDVEQQLLRDHEVIVLQFPMYWYSSPALLKQWQDDVLTWNFAFGEKGTSLKGKKLWIAVTTGSPLESFHAGGKSRFTIDEFMRPFEQTAKYCSLKFEPTFAVQGARTITDEILQAKTKDFTDRLRSYL